MSEPLMFKLKIEAIGEVRDKDGNLLSAEPVTTEVEVSEDDLRAMGLTDEQLSELQKGGQK